MPQPSPAPPLLSLRGVTKSFPGVLALSRVDLDLHAGEIHALVGENGAGKSTLIQIVTGAHDPDSGELRFEGRPLTRNSPRLAQALGIAAIYQQPRLLGELTVTENLLIGSDGPLLAWRRRRRRARELLDRVGARIDPDRPARELTLPEQQLVEIARALRGRARVLILDEPTASLAQQDADHLLAMLRDLRSQGVGILYISHRLEELGRIADRVSVLRDGRLARTLPMTEVDHDRLIQLMVGRSLASPPSRSGVAPGDVALEVQGLSSRLAGVRSADLVLHSGEIHGLAGLVGAGRTGLARVLFGLAPANAGIVRLRGKPVRFANTRDAIAAGVAYVPEDRRRAGIVPELSVVENVTLASLRRLARGGLLRDRAEEEMTRTWTRRLGVRAPSLHGPAAVLSGGNQQKLALCRWLARDPSILILDEPTQGIDVGAKREIHALIMSHASRGLAVLLISSDLGELLALSDRITVMHDGRTVGTVPRAGATEERILAMAFGRADKEGR